jgi:hypothetical protein
VVLDLVSGCRSEWVVVLVTSAEVVRNSGRRRVVLGVLRANLASLHVLELTHEGYCGEAGLSSLQGGRFWAAETTRTSNTCYRVWGGRTAVVRFDLSECARGFKLALSQSHDLFNL